MSKFGPTVAECLGFDGLKPNAERVSILRNIVWDKLTDMENGVYKPDHLNVFIKREPHKLAKIDEGRFRLIMGVSLEDTMIDRMLYGNVYDRAVRCFTQTPCKAGYSPIFGGYKYLVKLLGRTNMTSDKKAWDWHVTSWLVDLWQDFLQDLAGNPPDYWVLYHRSRFEALFGPDCSFVFPDGSVAKQRFKGVMKSGSYLTLLLNSVGQRIIQLAACYRLDWAPWTLACVGDDAMEEVPPDCGKYVETIEKLGFKIKEYHIRDYIDFCGFLMDDNGCVPAYWRKHLYKLYYDYDDEFQEQKLRTYAIMYSGDGLMYDLISKFYHYETGRSLMPRELTWAYWQGLIEVPEMASPNLEIVDPAPL